MPRNKDWAGVVVDFSGCDDTLESIFGTDDISPGILSRQLWAYIAEKGIKRATRARVALGGRQQNAPHIPPPNPADDIDDVRTFTRRRDFGTV